MQSVEQSSYILVTGRVLLFDSAGVGRAGCFICIDAMLDRMKFEDTLDVYGQVTCMRAERNYMVSFVVFAVAVYSAKPQLLLLELSDCVLIGIKYPATSFRVSSAAIEAFSQLNRHICRDPFSATCGDTVAINVEFITTHAVLQM